jgi:hypothetical protein
MKTIFFTLLKSLKKGVGSGVVSGAGSISRRYGSGDPDPHKNATDPLHGKKRQNCCFLASLGADGGAVVAQFVQVLANYSSE